MSTNFSDNQVDPEEWISQAEAARIRGVTPQAIHRLVQKGRLVTLEIGGHTLVSRADVLNLVKRKAGRPRKDEHSG